MEEKHPIKNYADGWVTEKEGTEVPSFLKFTYVVLGLGCVSYFIVYMNGEVDHPDRGKLVQAMNQATEPADTLMYVVAGMALIYVLAVLMVVFRKSEKH